MTAPIKLCLVGNSNSIHVCRWANHFASRGMSVSVLSVGRSDLKYDPGVQVEGLRTTRDGGATAGEGEFRGEVKALRRLLSPLVLGAFGFYRALDRIDPDIVHGHYLSSWGYVASRVRDRPVVNTIWGSDVLVDPVSSALTRHIVRSALSRSALVTCDASHVGDVAVQFGAQRDRLLRIVMGVDDQFWDAMSTAEPRDESAPLIVSHRSLEDPAYNVDTLIAAMPLIKEAAPSAHLVVGHDGVLRAGLERLAQDLGVANSVQFVGTASNPEELARRLSRATVFVSVPSSDGTSVTLLEAMAAGAFPVVSDLPANREWLDEDTAEFVAPRDPTSLAAAIVRILGQPERRARATAANRARVLQDGAWSKNMAAMEQAYGRLAGR